MTDLGLPADKSKDINEVGRGGALFSWGCKTINRNNPAKLGNCNFHLTDGLSSICNIFPAGNNCSAETGVKDDVGADSSSPSVKYPVDGSPGVRTKVSSGKQTKSKDLLVGYN